MFRHLIIFLLVGVILITFLYLCGEVAKMEQINIRIIEKSGDLPEMKAENFFHSPELFRITEQTTGSTPFMVVAEDVQGHCIAHLLAMVRRRGSLIPPYLYTHGRIYGQGEYDEQVDQEEVFGQMLKAITRKFKRRLCLYAEISDVHPKMFGYRMFRRFGYFPVHWQEVHNSLHSKDPAERISEKMRQRIEKAYALGVETRAVRSPEEVHAFYRLLRGFYRMKLRRLIPPEKQFLELNRYEKAQILMTCYHGKVIGGSACVYSEGNAYLWYLASRRKTYPKLHPKTMTLWYAIRYAYEHNYAHIFFMDVGLPWKKNPFRDFILSFGGKPVARYRWFRFSISWINSLLRWWYKE